MTNSEFPSVEWLGREVILRGHDAGTGPYGGGVSRLAR